MNRQTMWLISVSSSVLGTPAFAQTGAPVQTEVPAPPSSSATTPPAASKPTDLSEGDIVVTAQNRAESLQSAPIAASALDEDALRSHGIDDVGNLAQTELSLVFQKSRNTLQIRGVERQLVTVAGDDGVDIHPNSAPLLANRGDEAECFGIESVEGLRGLQGTLYGPSATGSVVNIITNKPTARTEDQVAVELGNYDSVRMFSHLNLPLSNSLALRVSGFGLRRDGYTTNLLTKAIHTADGFGPPASRWAIDPMPQCAPLPRGSISTRTIPAVRLSRRARRTRPSLRGSAYRRARRRLRSPKVACRDRSMSTISMAQRTNSRRLRAFWRGSVAFNPLFPSPAKPFRVTAPTPPARSLGKDPVA